MFYPFKQGFFASVRQLALALPLLLIQPSHANNTAIATSDDVVAITQVAKHNEAVNEAIFGNEVIAEFNQQTSTNQTKSNNQATVTPKQSSQQGVSADKLILNNPVIDQAKILSAKEQQEIANKLRDIYQRGLAQPAVVIVPTTNGEDIFQYSMTIADKWQLGNKDTDKGLLMVIAINDRKLQILTGYGLEGAIPDAVAKRIIRDDIAPYFKQNDYAGGIVAGINRLEERLTTDPDILRQADSEREKISQVSQISPIAFAVIGLFIGVFLTGLFGRLLGTLMTTIGTIAIGTMLGLGFITSVIIALIIGFILLNRSNRGGGVVIMPSGGGSFGGGFGGGGGSGYSGGGGGFGGGGAGGSW